MIMKLVSDDATVRLSEPPSPHSPLTRVLRRIVPHRLFRGSSLVDDPAAHRLLRQMEACGYRVRVWHDDEGGCNRLVISAHSEWAMRTHVAYAVEGPNAEIIAAASLAEHVASEMEG